MSAPRTLRIEDFDLSVTVLGGTGYVDFEYYGYLYRIAGKPAVETDSWHPEISDKDGFPVWKSPSAVVGTQPISIDQATKHKNRLTITGDDGTYTLRITADHGI